jgi:undecaprenyl diphosphate synthase
MDGNGRWAQARGRPRALGHRLGVQAARRVVRAASDRGIPYITLFAFSQENWYRPEREVSVLMRLFARSMRRERADLQRNRVRMRFIGDTSAFAASLRAEMRAVEAVEVSEPRIEVRVALGYGGKWDICQAAERARREGVPIDETALAARLSTAGTPDPDLLIRTGGEQRISNFMLWQMAYAELCFIDTLWPDFDDADLDAALGWYARRQRRFGRLKEPG